MTHPMQFGEPDRRGRVERRGGVDTRPLELRQSQGERRSGGDRRTAAARKPAAPTPNWIYACLLMVVFCIGDVRLYNGDHSVQLAIGLGRYANSLASQWVGGPFGR